MPLPFKKARTYRFIHKIGKSKRVKYLIAENLRAAKKLIKQKGICLVGKIMFYRTILIVSDEKKVQAKLATKRWIENGF